MVNKERRLTTLTWLVHNEIMKTLQSAEAKTHFSSILKLKDVEAGNEVVIAYGKKKQTIAVIIPYEKWKKSQKRELGTLEGKMSVSFRDDFKMTDEEIINL
jgi:antitoxin (DNA-binding transcriptional repressor) of toxin-antitoxin stability system